MKRREFLINTTALTVGSIVLGASCSAPKSLKTKISNENGIVFEQQNLPYAFNALEPIIDKQTMEIHFGKHAAAYAKNFKEAFTNEKITDTTYENLFANISKYSNTLRNNAGGHYNHEMFWKLLQPETANNKPQGKLLTAIEQQFKSFDNFKAEFEKAAKGRFGSGWAWLIINSNKQLEIVDTANQDNPLMHNVGVKSIGQPLLALDVWEHAYYLKYQNKRADYISNFFKIINWNFVNKKYETYV